MSEMDTINKMRELRDAFGSFMTGVTVVTTCKRWNATWLYSELFCFGVFGPSFTSSEYCQDIKQLS